MSFISDISEAKPYQFINSDIFAQAYASYLVGLSDVALPDNHYDAPLYGFFMKSLDFIVDKIYMVVVTFIFELQVMSRFGAQLDFGQCVFCHRKDLPMDFLSTPVNCSWISKSSTSDNKGIFSVA